MIQINRNASGAERKPQPKVLRKKDRAVKYTVSVEFNGKTYTTESENIVVPGTATGKPDTPDVPSQNDNICKWDNVDHGTTFWGRLVKFFHSILYFFAHLFGKR